MLKFNPAQRQSIIVMLSLVILGLLFRVWFLSLPLDRDVGLFVLIGQNLSQGVLPYCDIFDHKPPAIYFTFWALSKVAGLSLFSVSMLALIWYIFNSVLVYLLTKELFGFKPALVAGFLYSFFSVNPYAEGTNAAQTEVFLISFLLLSYLFFFYHLRKNKVMLLSLSGLSLGIAFLFKQIAIFDLALLISLFLFTKKRLKDFIVFFIFLAAPSILTGLFFALKGCFSEFFYYAYLFNIQYARQETTAIVPFIQKLFEKNTSILATMPLLSLASLSFVVAALVRFKSIFKERNIPRIFLLLWLLVVVAAVSSTGKFFSYYFILYIPVLSVASAVALCSLFEYRKKKPPLFKITGAVIVLALFFISFYKFSGFIASDSLETMKRIWPKEPFAEAYQIGKYLKENTAKDDYLFVWGDEPEIYFYAQRRSSSYYRDAPVIYFFPQMKEDPYKVIMEGLYRNPPKYVVIDTRHFAAFKFLPMLLDYFNTHYSIDKVEKIVRNDRLINNMVILKRKVGE